jgi:hypothetical protein
LARSARLAAILALTFSLSVPAAEHRGKVVLAGLPVPGVSITATRGDQTFSAISDAQGDYVFPDLPDGTWRFYLAMSGFAAIDRDVAVAPGAPAAEWDLQMLPLAEMEAAAAAPPVTIAAITATPPAAPPTAPAGAVPRSRKGKNAAPGPTNTQTPFRRAEVNAVADAAPPPDTAAGQNNGELAQRAGDGFLINGTTNNAALHRLRLPRPSATIAAARALFTTAISASRSIIPRSMPAPIRSPARIRPGRLTAILPAWHRSAALCVFPTSSTTAPTYS